jgi:hypothetical protein
VIVRHRALGAGADALADLPGATVHGDRVVEHAEHRLVQRQIDHLALAGALGVA